MGRKCKQIVGHNAGTLKAYKYLTQGRSKLDNWGGGCYLYWCSAQLISFEIDCFHSA